MINYIHDLLGKEDVKYKLRNLNLLKFSELKKYLEVLLSEKIIVKNKNRILHFIFNHIDNFIHIKIVFNFDTYRGARNEALKSTIYGANFEINDDYNKDSDTLFLSYKIDLNMLEEDLNNIYTYRKSLKIVNKFNL